MEPDTPRALNSYKLHRQEVWSASPAGNGRTRCHRSFVQLTPFTTCHPTQSFSTQPSIFCSNISDASIDVLKNRFSDFGEVMDAYFVTGCRPSPPTSGESTVSLPEATKSAIIKFDSWTSAERAFEHFSLSSNSETLSVRYARPRGDSLGESIAARRLFVGQLPPDISQDEVIAYFSPYGEVVHVSLLDTKPSAHGCAFVEFSTWAACDRAITAGNGTNVFGGRSLAKALVVKYAKSKQHSLNGGHGYPRVGSLNELVGGGLWPQGHMLEPPTTGYIIYRESMPYTVPAFWPMAQHGCQQIANCHPCYPPEYMMPMPPVPVPSALHAAHASHVMYHSGGGDVDSRKIFVGQLPRTVTEEALAAMFAVFGPVEQVTVLREGARCGFVTFASRFHALRAVDEMHGAAPYGDGRQLVVRLASRRSLASVVEEDGDNLG